MVTKLKAIECFSALSPCRTYTKTQGYSWLCVTLKHLREAAFREVCNAREEVRSIRTCTAAGVRDGQQGPCRSQQSAGSSEGGRDRSSFASGDGRAEAEQIAELEERAQLFGDPVKQSAQAKVLERKWYTVKLKSQ
eukprot:scaffold40498_cov73-Phaeocystis_antarctica.AAC.2